MILSKTYFSKHTWFLLPALYFISVITNWAILVAPAVSNYYSWAVLYSLGISFLPYFVSSMCKTICTIYMTTRAKKRSKNVVQVGSFIRYFMAEAE